MENKLIVQHNDLTFARYNMSEAEKNIFLVLLSRLGKEDEPGKTYTITVKEIEQAVGRKQNYKQIDEACDKLWKRGIKVRNPQDRRKWIGINLCESVEYNVASVEFVLTNKIRPYLFHLKENFTVYELAEALSLKGKYSKRLYEMFSSYKNHKYKEKDQFEVTVPELREYLELGNELEEWYDVKRKIIEPSIKEVNKKSSLTVGYSTKKLGRSVHWLTFDVQSKQQEDNKREEKISSGFSEWQLVKIKERLTDQQRTVMRHHANNAFRDYSQRKDGIKNVGLFWAEFAQGFARKHYKVELELVKDSKDPFKFDWSIYKPSSKG